MVPAMDAAELSRWVRASEGLSLAGLAELVVSVVWSYGGLSPEDQAAFRALLATLATHVNSLDPVATACDAVVDIGTRAQP